MKRVCGRGRLGFWVVAAALMLTACGAVRPVSPDEARATPKNLDFEAGTYAGRLPNGWGVGRGSGAGSPDDYTYRLDQSVKHGGRASLMIKFTAPRFRSHGGVFQCLYGRGFTGRARLTGYIKTSGASGDGAFFWMQASDTDGRSVAFRNMDGRRVRRTTDWAEHAIEIEITEPADELCFGFTMDGPGTTWADDLSLALPRALKR